MKMKLSSIAANLLKVAVTVGILGYLYRNGMLDLFRVREVLTDATVVSLTLFILIFTNLAAVIRWFNLLLGQDLKISFADAFRLNMIGVFFNTAIPGAVSGDVVKGYYVVRKQPNGKGRIKAFTTLLMDRLLGLCALIFVSFFAMILNVGEMLASPTLKPLCGLIALLWVGVLVFLTFVLVEWSMFKKLNRVFHKVPIVGDLIGRFFEAVKAYENCKHVIITGLLISIVIHCSVIGAFLLLSNALGGFSDVSAHRFFFLVPFGLLVTAIPIAPAGLGTGHAAFLGLFKLVGSKSGADLFTAFVTFQIFISLVGGVFYLRSRHSLKLN